MRRVSLASDRLTLEVDPDNGAEIGSIRLDELELLLELDSSKQAAPTQPSPAEAWLADYAGGWQLLFPNVGAAAHVDGRHHGYHGDASRTRWTVDVHEDTQTRLTTVVHDFEVSREIRVDGTNVIVTTSARNDAAEAQPFVWSEHPAFPLRPHTRVDFTGPAVVSEPTRDRDDDAEDATDDWPFLDVPGGVIDVRRPPGVGDERLVLVTPSAGAGAATISGAEGPDLCLEWDTDSYPSAWVWMQHGVHRWPFHGAAAALAVEPTNAPTMDGLASLVETDQAMHLAPGSTVSGQVRLSVVP